MFGVFLILAIKKLPFYNMPSRLNSRVCEPYIERTQKSGLKMSNVFYHIYNHLGKTLFEMKVFCVWSKRELLNNPSYKPGYKLYV